MISYKVILCSCGTRVTVAAGLLKDKIVGWETEEDRERKIASTLPAGFRKIDSEFVAAARKSPDLEGFLQSVMDSSETNHYYGIYPSDMGKDWWELNYGFVSLGLFYKRGKVFYRQGRILKIRYSLGIYQVNKNLRENIRRKLGRDCTIFEFW